MNAQGHTTLSIDGQDYKLRLGFSEIADADEYLGRSLIQSLQEEPSNFHLIRTAFYFASREHSKIGSVKKAGKILDGSDLESVGEAIFDAVQASGLFSDDEDSGEA